MPERHKGTKQTTTLRGTGARLSVGKWTSRIQTVEEGVAIGVSVLCFVLVISKEALYIQPNTGTVFKVIFIKVHSTNVFSRSSVSTQKSAFCDTTEGTDTRSGGIAL